MPHDLEAMIRELKDRQEILDCLHRYCRGIDRLDREAVRSAYHPDAIDDHGDYVGDVEGFIDWAFDYHSRKQTRTAHNITNHLCEIEGDTAHAETYWSYSGVNREAPYQSTSTGRYIDRLERRKGRWGIVRRICVLNSVGAEMDPEGRAGDLTFIASTRDISDPAYMRPLEVDIRRLTRQPT